MLARNLPGTHSVHRQFPGKGTKQRLIHGNGHTVLLDFIFKAGTIQQPFRHPLFQLQLNQAKQLLNIVTAEILLVTKSGTSLAPRVQRQFPGGRTSSTAARQGMHLCMCCLKACGCGSSRWAHKQCKVQFVGNLDERVSRRSNTKHMHKCILFRSTDFAAVASRQWRHC